MNDLTELDHYEQLRAWAKGLYPLEAATELLIRTGWAQQSRPWVKPNDTGGHWIDFETIPDQVGGLSGGERRLLVLAASIGAGTPVDLEDCLSGLDRGTVGLVLAAVAHAAGTHEGVQVTVDENDRPTFSRVGGALYPWPE